MSVSIFTITHMPFTPPDNPIYIPLQVGRAIHEDYGYLGDDTGDNISDKNQYYSELTGLYWIWKNYTHADYLGLCHYRRYFLNMDHELMTESDYIETFSQFDVIIAKPSFSDYDYQTVYARAHNINNLIMTGEVIKELYPDYYATFEEIITGHYCYIGNLFAAPEKLFRAYCEWLFTIFFTLERRINIDNYDDDYHKRVFGFLSEQLLFVWIKHNHLSYYEAPYTFSQEKAETILLKQNIKEFIKKKDTTGAYQYLSATLNKRPDLIIGMSDFNQELKTIEHILNICRIEDEAGLPTMLQFSDEYDILIQHFRLLVTILKHIKSNTVTEDEIQYLIRCKISYKGIVYIIQNFNQLAANPLRLLNQLAVIYANVGEFLCALFFLEEALSIRETDKDTLSNIVVILESMDELDMADEYRQLLTDVSSESLRFVVFLGSDIPILNYIAEQYASALESFGHIVLRFDKHDFEASVTTLFSFQKEGLDAAIVFNNACFQMLLQSGNSIWDTWNVPCYNIIVDHPMYYFETLNHAPENGIVACADRYHVNYIKRFYPTVKKTLFLPTAGEYRKSYEELKPFTERSIDVLFIGSYKYHYDIVYDSFDRKLEKELFLHPDKTFEKALEDCLDAENIHMSEAELKEFIQNHRFVDTNTTALFRVRIIQTLINAGISVTIYGNGWNALDIFQHPNFHYMGLIPPEAGITLMENSKIVLNHMAWFKAGASERIFEAMLQGAISLTDGSAYLKENFTDSVNIRFYSLKHVDMLPDMVRSMLSTPSLTESMRQNAYQNAIDEHTWSKRASILLQDLLQR